jgi:hypothetical protein
MTKPAYKSLAIGSAVLFGFVGVLEANGLVPAGVGEQIAASVQSLAAVGAIWGVRRAIPGS